MIAYKDNRLMSENSLDLIRDELVKAMRLAEQGKHRQAIDACQQMLKSAASKAIPLPEGFAGALLTRMGLSMAAQSDWEQALFHYRLAEGLLLRRKESIRQVRARYHIALYRTDDDLRLLLTDIYQALGQAYDAREETERSLGYYKQAYKVAASMENTGLAWRALTSIAANYQARSLWTDLQSAAERLIALNERDPQPTREIIARRYLAQAYGKTGCIDDMMAELERIVTVGRASGHPDLAHDEKALARAQQAIGAASRDTIQTVSVSAPESARSTTEVVETPAVGTVTLSKRSTPKTATECPPDLISNITVEVETENGVSEAVFVLHTRYPEQAQSLFGLFRLTLLPVSIPAMRELGDNDIPLPDGGSLYIELSLHDLKPNMLLHSLVIPDAQLDALELANRTTKRLKIYLESKEGPFGKRKRVLVPNLFEPYVLDWRGMTGLVRHLRRSAMSDGATLNEQDAYHLLTLLQMPLKDNLPATGIYREMGFIYRQVGASENAIASFQEEVLFSLGKDGIPGAHAAQALRQLGLIHEANGDSDKAFDAFRAALAVNPNSFDTLTAIAGILTDATEALRYLGRAYRIRSEDAAWAGVIERAVAAFNRTPQQIEQAIAIVATQVDLSARYDLDKAALARLGIG
jgi:tetratricopeptide (TPR) repeat protein